jgi:hypothetical protein
MKLLRVCLLICLLGLFMNTSASANEGSVLNTEHFRIRIIENCSEGEVGCHDVSYLGVNKTTGKSIALKGKNKMHVCSDGITPCHPVYYEFRNGVYRYLVYPDGVFVIEKRGKPIASEKGVWER